MARIAISLAGTSLALLLATVASCAASDVTDAARSEKRVALVIGNATYSGAPLRNPVNDARAVSRTLKALGFEVISVENSSQKQIRRAIIDFGARLQQGGVGLFYYAGHGLQVAGRNYIVPVDAVITSESEIDVESVDVATVLARMETAKSRLNVVILDACRDNPFARSFRTLSRGLASIDAPAGTLIAYSTAPGRLARDGEGQNSLYTAELVRALVEPGLPLESVFKRVTAAVRRQTSGEQVPWVASSVEGDFFFSTRAAASPPERRDVAKAAPPPIVPKEAVPKEAMPKDAVPKAAVPQTAVPQAAPPQAAVPQVPPAMERHVAPAPKLQVGDEWRYTNGVVLKVVAVEDGKPVTTLTPNPRCPECRYYRDENLTVLRVVDKKGAPVHSGEIGLQIGNFPLEVGKTWTSNIMMFSQDSNRHLPYNNTFKVERIVNVNTKAGPFLAYEISWLQENKGAGMSWTGRATLYYSPKARAVVKREVHARNWYPDMELEALRLSE